MSHGGLTIITDEYLDGLSTTVNATRRAAFERARDLLVGNRSGEALPLFGELLGESESSAEEVALLILIGNCLFYLGRLEEAQRSYTEALEKARKQGEREAEAAALGNVGLVHRQKGDLFEAAQHHQGALKTYEQIGNIPGQAKQLSNLGLVYLQKGDPGKAVEHYQMALAMYTRIGASIEIEKAGRILAEIGKTRPKKK